MQLALTLGRRGLGRTWPNPAVGAVVVKDGVIVGRGWTQPGGRPHAEPEGLEARRRGRARRHALCHARAVLAFRQVAALCRRHHCRRHCSRGGFDRGSQSGSGGTRLCRLRAAGIAVDIGLGAAEATLDHAGHIRRIRDKRPHVILKLAVSADDKIAAMAASRSLRSPARREDARAFVARAERRNPGRYRDGAGGRSAVDLPAARHGGALAGAGGAGPCAADTGRGSRLLHSARQTPLWVMTSETSEAAAAARLGAAGAQVMRVHATPGGLDVPAVLHALSDKGHHPSDGGGWRARGVVLCRGRRCR